MFYILEKATSTIPEKSTLIIPKINIPLHYQLYDMEKYHQMQSTDANVMYIFMHMVYVLCWAIWHESTDIHAYDLYGDFIDMLAYGLYVWRYIMDLEM